MRAVAGKVQGMSEKCESPAGRSGLRSGSRMIGSSGSRMIGMRPPMTADLASELATATDLVTATSLVSATVTGAPWATDLVSARAAMTRTGEARTSTPRTGMARIGMAGSQGLLGQERARTCVEDDPRWATADLTRRPVPVAVASAVLTAAVVRALLGWRHR